MGSRNFDNASFNESSSLWLKHHTNASHGQSSCKSLISLEFDPLFTDATSDDKKTIFLSAESKPYQENPEIMASFKPGAS